MTSFLGRSGEARPRPREGCSGALRELDGREGRRDGGKAVLPGQAVATWPPDSLAGAPLTDNIFHRAEQTCEGLSTPGVYLSASTTDLSINLITPSVAFPLMTHLDYKQDVALSNAECFWILDILKVFDHAKERLAEDRDAGVFEREALDGTKAWSDSSWGPGPQWTRAAFVPLNSPLSRPDIFRLGKLCLPSQARALFRPNEGNTNS